MQSVEKQMRGKNPSLFLPGTDTGIQVVHVVKLMHCRARGVIGSYRGFYTPLSCTVALHLQPQAHASTTLRCQGYHIFGQ